MIRFLLLALFIAGPLRADPAWVQFFEAPEAVVDRTADGTREAVQLPGSVQIVRTRNGDGWDYAGVDRSDHGAVGCIALILIELNSIEARCAGTFPAEQTGRLQAHLTRLSAYYATNAVPETTAADFMAAAASHAASAPDLQCEDITDGVKMLAETVLGAGSDTVMDDLLSTPRLPVINPCL